MRKCFGFYNFIILVSNFLLGLISHMSQMSIIRYLTLELQYMISKEIQKSEKTHIETVPCTVQTSNGCHIYSDCNDPILIGLVGLVLLFFYSRVVLQQCRMALLPIILGVFCGLLFTQEVHGNPAGASLYSLEFMKGTISL